MKNLGEEFVWWYGVVEDRADPLQLGRVRVRCYGWHTDNKKDIPTEDLPWAQPIQDITSAAISGIGKSATGLVEGTWVIGFFADGKEAQRPIIMGSIAGIPTVRPDSGDIGFFDPTGTYPTKDSFLQADTPTLAKNNAEEDETLISKRKAKDSLGKIPTASAPEVSSVKTDRYSDATYAEKDGEDSIQYWEEPNPRYGGETKNIFPDGVASSGYPYNHVYNSESGHVFEVDDSPGAERLHKYHTAGSFEEIQPDGTRVHKVVGKNYEVVISDENIYIRGSQNITVVGNCKLYVQGDHYTEVDGNQYVTVRGDRVTKIQGNDLKEVMSDESTQINGNKNERVSKDRRSIVDSTYTETIGKDKKTTIKKNETKTVMVNLRMASLANTTIGVGKNMKVENGETYNHKSVGAATETFQSTSTQQFNGKSVMDFNGDSHMRFDADKYEHIGADTYTWIANDKVDHTNAAGPTGRTGAADTNNSTTDNT